MRTFSWNRIVWAAICAFAHFLTSQDSEAPQRQHHASVRFWQEERQPYVAHVAGYYTAFMRVFFHGMTVNESGAILDTEVLLSSHQGRYEKFWSAEYPYFSSGNTLQWNKRRPDRNEYHSHLNILPLKKHPHQDNICRESDGIFSGGTLRTAIRKMAAGLKTST